MLFFIIGLVFGSFFNSLVYRLENNKKIFFSRSQCPFCSHQLNFFDLIPLFSFIFLKGKCRYCQNKISFLYPLGEFLTGILFFSFYLRFKDILNFNLNSILFFVFWLGFLSILFLLAYYDLKTQYISMPILFFAFFWAGLFLILSSKIYQIDFLETLNSVFSFNFSGRILFNLILILILISFAFFGFLGWGDVIIVFWLGIFLKPPELFLSLILAGLFGSLFSLPLLILKKYNLKTQIPFLPFIFLGVWFTIILGENLMKIFGL